MWFHFLFFPLWDLPPLGLEQLSINTSLQEEACSHSSCCSFLCKIHNQCSAGCSPSLPDALIFSRKDDIAVHLDTMEVQMLSSPFRFAVQCVFVEPEKWLFIHFNFFCVQ